MTIEAQDPQPVAFEACDDCCGTGQVVRDNGEPGLCYACNGDTVQPVAVPEMDEEDRTSLPDGYDASRWRKADELHHAMALVAKDEECVKIIYAALTPPAE